LHRKGYNRTRILKIKQWARGSEDFGDKARAPVPLANMVVAGAQGNLPGGADERLLREIDGQIRLET